MNKISPMTGFEPRTSGVGSDRSTNWATTAAMLVVMLLKSFCVTCLLLKIKIYSQKNNNNLHLLALSMGCRVLEWLVVWHCQEKKTAIPIKVDLLDEDWPSGRNWEQTIEPAVVAQLVEWSLPTPEVHGLNPVIGKILFMYSLSTVLKRRKWRKRGRKWPILKKNHKNCQRKLKILPNC